MFNSVKHWLLVRELLRLSQLDSFESATPTSLILLLERYAISKVRNNLETDPLEHHALTIIWSHSKREFQKDKENRIGWHKVMASCNALQEPYTGSFTEAVSLH